jgi:gliding motility-associated-like protein
MFQSVLGCDSAVTVNLTVNPIPEMPQLISNSPVPCPGDIVLIQTDHVPFGNYTWTGPVNFVATTSDISFAVTDQNTGDYSVFVTVNGCNSPLAVSPVGIQLNDQIHNFDFPNVITANQDKVNDSLDIDPNFNPCVEYSLTIFNRWGEVVFEQNYGSKPFSGSDQNGNKLVDGVYFYKFVFREEARFGSITLLN